MKSLKIFFLAALVALAGVFTACTEDSDWNAGPQEDGLRVFFSNENASSVEVDNTMSSIDLVVMRTETEGVMEVSVASTIDPEYASLFTVDQTLLFEDGAAEGVVKIAFDYNKLTAGKTYEVAVNIVDETLHSNYANPSQTVSIVVPEPYVLLGKGLFREDMVFTLWTGSNSDFFEVEIYENTNYPGYIFLKNVYTKAFPFEALFELYGKEISASYPEEDCYFVIDASNPDKVIIPTQKIGLTLSTYGEIIIGMISAAGVGTIDDCAGTFKDGVITFPTKGLVIQDSDGASYSNTKGAFMLCMPGVEATDYAMEVAYNGMTVAADNKTTEAVFKGTYGADVASFKYVFFNDDVTAFADEIAAGVADGTFEADGEVEVEAGLDEEMRVFSFTDKGVLEAPGQYTVAVIPCNADGELQVGGVAAAAFYYAGIGAAEVPAMEMVGYCDSFLTYFPSYAGQGYDETNALAWILKGGNKEVSALGLAGFWPSAAIDNVIAQGATLKAIYAGNGGKALDQSYVAEMNTYGFTYDGITGLPADTAISGIGYGKNKYGSEIYVRIDGKTAAAAANSAAAAMIKGKGVFAPRFNGAYSGVYKVTIEMK